MAHYLHLIAEKRKKGREAAQKLREKLLSDIDEALLELSKLIPFQEAYIFGSITRPHGFLPDSDVDMAFYGLRNEDFFKAISFLSRRLEKDVDVVQLEGHRLEEKIKSQGIRWKGIRWIHYRTHFIQGF
jgi:hypothetical protein